MENFGGSMKEGQYPFKKKRQMFVWCLMKYTVCKFPWKA